MKKFIVSLMIALLITSNCGCSVRDIKNAGEYALTDEKPYQYRFTAFDTECAISIYGVKNDSLAETYAIDMSRLVFAYEDMFSKTKVGSEIYDINHRTTNYAMISNTVATLFNLGRDFYSWSDNKFDIGLGTLIDLWDVKNRKTLPSLSEINNARQHCGNFNYVIEYNVAPNEERCNKITFNGDQETKFDLGGLVKGFCCNSLNDMLKENENISACIVNLGGNVLCYGEVESRSGGAFNIGIFKPFSGNDIIETVSVINRSVITSGNYQRYFKIDGDETIYHHIIDPATGYPVNNGLDSVTIISENPLLGDYLSTACMLVGEEKARKLIDFCSKSFNDKNLQGIFVYSHGAVTKYPKKVKTT